MKLNRSVMFAVLAAVCYGVSIPFSKILLNNIPPVFMASLLYLGAGIGMGFVVFIKKLKNETQPEANLGIKDLPYIIGIVILDIIAPILLMFGLMYTTAANVSLLNNFEIAATSLIALIIFKETIGKRMWLAIILITISTIILSLDFEDFSGFSFSFGSLLVLGSCVSWGFENNCTRMLSLKNPLEIVVIKGIGSGIGSLLIVFFTKTYSFNVLYIILAMLLGFFAYGLSLYFYILAQRTLGASRTSAYYAFAPFVGVMLSFVFFRDGVNISFLIALAIMLTGTYLAASERHSHKHMHETVQHEHRHSHNDGHHNHIHSEITDGEHNHLHTHENTEHNHLHTPDFHHNHTH